MKQLLNQSFSLDLSTKDCVIIEPQWIAGQCRRVKREDRGAAHTLILDDFPFQSRAVPFSLLQKGNLTVEFVGQPESGNDWKQIGEGSLILDSGKFAIVEEERVVDALALWRDKTVIGENLITNWSIDPGQYEFKLWQRAKQNVLRVSIKETINTSTPHDSDENEDNYFPEPVVMEITEELDLHTFPPNEIKPIMEEYLQAACQKGYSEVRIVHGKGIGELRRMTHSILKNHPRVERYYDAPLERGGFGATIAELRRINKDKTK